jgi:hypothetical protein
LSIRPSDAVILRRSPLRSTPYIFQDGERSKRGQKMMHGLGWFATSWDDMPQWTPTAVPRQLSHRPIPSWRGNGWEGCREWGIGARLNAQRRLPLPPGESQGEGGSARRDS